MPHMTRCLVFLTSSSLALLRSPGTTQMYIYHSAIHHTWHTGHTCRMTDIHWQWTCSVLHNVHRTVYVHMWCNHEQCDTVISISYPVVVSLVCSNNTHKMTNRINVWISTRCARTSSRCVWHVLSTSRRLCVILMRGAHKWNTEITTNLCCVTCVVCHYYSLAQFTV